MTSLDRDILTFPTLCPPQSLSHLTHRHYPRVVGQCFSSAPCPLLSTMDMTPVVPKMFQQEVFKGQQLRGCSEWVEESAHVRSQSYSLLPSKACVHLRTYRKLSKSVFSQHVVGHSQLAVLGPVAR